MRKTDIPVIDMLNDTDEVSALSKTDKGAAQGRDKTNANNYVFGVALERRIRRGDQGLQRRRQIHRRGPRAAQRRLPAARTPLRG